MKKNLFFTITICIIAISFSCTNNNKKSQKKPEIDWTGKEINLSNSKKIIVPTNPLLTEVAFHLINDQYFFCMFSFYQDRTLHAYNLQNDTLNYVGKVTQKGNGPLEMEDRSFVHQLPNKSLILTTEGYNPKCFLLQDSDFSKITNLGQWELIKFPDKETGTMVERTLPLNDSRILVKVMGDVPAPFAYYRAEDSILTYFSYPHIKTDIETNNAQKTMMYTGKIFKHPTKNRIINTCQEGTYACILDIEDNNMKLIKHIYNELPEFILDKDGSNSHPKNSNKLGFSCITVTEKYIYIKKRDFTLGEIKAENINNDYPQWFDNKIYVFDWEGNPVKKYNLDKYVCDIVVDSNNKFIYAQTMDKTDGSCSIIKYEL